MPSEAVLAKTLTAQNQFTTGSPFAKGHFNLSIWGSFVATVTLQRSFDDGDTWLDVETFTDPVERLVANAEDAVYWRVGVKTGQFSSGTVHVRLGQ